MANMRPTKVEMPEQPAQMRAQNFDEVALGYTPQQAMEEATRCLQCQNRPCVANCPVGVAIPEFLRLVVEGNFQEAYDKIKQTNSLPAVCGRVCPQENQCEMTCVRGLRGEPVGIGRLERFVADYALSHPQKEQPGSAPAGGKKVAVIGAGPAGLIRSSKKVAVIGAGPAGLTCAGDLIDLGHEVTIFESLHTPGGVLVYGIPEFRLPKALVQQEIRALEHKGVRIQLNSVVGQLYTIQQLQQGGYDAVFLGTGAGLPRFLNIPGENLNTVFSSNEFLTRINLMNAYQFPRVDTPYFVGDSCAVIGGGNVAMDAARTARRLGAREVHIIYRRSEVEMPARAEEIEHAKQEGIVFHLLTAPVAIHGDECGNATQLECLRMELGEPDASGRCRPHPVSGSNFRLAVDSVIVAIGQTPNPMIKATTPGLETTPSGCVVADEQTGQTNLEGVYAGGDVVSGAATVILAMGAGKKAAKAIDEYLKK